MTMVYQDMNQPLTEYYVHSSHNTYLVGNQLTSDSRAFRYIEDFYDGVRCVELDIHVRLVLCRMVKVDQSSNMVSHSQLRCPSEP
jgi:hypothetical protein